MEDVSGVRTIMLARAEARNALTPGMLGEVRGAIESVGADAGIGAVVLAGEGPVFCAGFDLAMCRDSADGSVMRELLTGLDGVVRAMRACAVPVVVAAQKAAIAGACAIVAAADFAVADRGARFGYPVVLLGISPGVSAPTLMPGVGTGVARKLMLDPGLIGAEEAFRVGLVSDLVDSAEEVGTRAMAVAAGVAGKPRAGVAATKSWLNRLDGGDAGGGEGLACSLGLTGCEEERELLERFWTGREG